MSSCDFCGETMTEIKFKCSYCGGSYCQVHRLPETHECANIAQATPPGSRPDENGVFKKSQEELGTAGSIDLAELKERANMESQPYSAIEVEQTVGATPEPDYDTSPDVALDGSIKDESEDVEEMQPEIETAGSITRTVIIVVSVVLVLLMVGILLGVV